MVVYRLIDIPDIIPQDPADPTVSWYWYFYSKLSPLAKAREMKRKRHHLRKHIYNRRQFRKDARIKQTARQWNRDEIRDKIRRRPLKSPDRLTYTA